MSHVTITYRNKIINQSTGKDHTKRKSPSYLYFKKAA